MQPTYLFSILTPQQPVFQELVYAIIAPGVEGYLEILAGHAPLITLVQPGRLSVMDQQHCRRIYAVSEGILEVSAAETHLLIDAIEAASAIDLERAQAAYARAHARLNSQEASIDRIRAQKALLRAKNRIQIYQDIHS